MSNQIILHDSKTDENIYILSNGKIHIIYLLHHLLEGLALVLAQALVVLHAAHVQLVLGLRLGRLERARQDGQLHVLQRGEKSVI